MRQKILRKLKESCHTCRTITALGQSNKMLASDRLGQDMCGTWRHCGMKCNECGLCVSLDSEGSFAWQCNLTGDSWAGSSPAGIARSCFAPMTAKTAFINRLLGGNDALTPALRSAQTKLMSKE